MTKYKAYPEYKDSGVEWLGEIPESWSMWKLSHAFENIGSGTTPTSNNESWFQGEIPWVTTGELRESIIYNTFKNVSKTTIQAFSALKIHPAGSVVIAMYGATIGRLGILGVDATTNQACCVMTQSNVIDNRYLYFWLQAFKEDIINLSSGGGQPNINQEKIASLKISSPKINDQREIIQFLACETSKIDSLINKQQQLIELLKEKRQAVISHAVTKGLNPDVPMKDSGIEWLGEVPKHWGVIKLKYLISCLEQGWSPQCESRIADKNEYGVLKVGCVNSGVFEPLENKALPSNLAPQKKYLIRKGDLLISRANTKELVGSSAVVDADYDRLILCDKLYRLIFKITVSPYFVSEYLRTHFVREQIELSASGASSSMQNIGQDTIKEMYISVPPLSEIEMIIEFIEKEKDKYSELITYCEKQISLLQERRTALISAAVTGKIDVRNWVAPAACEAASDTASQEVNA